MAKSSNPVLRRCVGCGEMFDKKLLVRVIRTPEGEVKIDPTCRQNGRGAYLCRRLSCLETALKKRSLERSLKCAPDPSVAQSLREIISSGESAEEQSGQR